MSEELIIEQIYTEEDALKSSLKYFNGDDLAAKTFLSKYALRNEKGFLLEDNPEKMHWRIANEFARIESKKFKNPLNKEEIFGYLDRFKYIVPQGSPMFGIGNKYQNVSISNCFLLESPEDSYNSILDIDKQLVNISKRRGGVGIDLSKLRPFGAKTSNAAKTSGGIILWMERYSNSIREVGQGGRRGALMLSLSVHHPDIINFSTIKNDNLKVTGANISVKLTKEFLDAVKNNKEYELRFPIDYKEKGIDPIVSKWVDANEIWKIIINSAWLRAEPGLLMWDNVEKNTPADCYEEYKSIGTNPCQPAWATVLTKTGLSTFGKIKEGDEIWSETGWTTVVKKWSNGVKKIYKYGTTAGSFYGTENHRIVSCGEKIEAKDAESIDILSGPYSSEIIIDPQIVMDGIVFGDGSIHKASNNLVYLYIGKDDSDYFNSEIQHLILKHRPGIKDTAYEVLTNITANELPLTYLRSIPDRYVFANKNTVSSFLRGLYTANGSFVGGRVALKASSIKVIEQVQLMLSSLGITSYYTTNKSKNITFSNGDYQCRQSYDLNITKDKDKFCNIIGFIQNYKNNKLSEFIENQEISNKIKKTYDITYVDFVSEEEVFDITVSNQTHTYWTGGLNVSNCGEINLSPLDSCRLLCLNLLSYVDNPFEKNAKFNYDLFYKHSQIAQRLMDDMVDLESEKIQQILEKIKKDPESKIVKQAEIDLWTKIKKFNDEGRRTGTGITALGDTIAALGIKYGSKESIILTGKIYETLKLGVYDSSVSMAEELGSFKIFNIKLEENNPFINRIKEIRPDIYERMAKYGRRNISLTTTAPTGTVSIMTQTTSGIEPLFMMGYTRRKKINPNDINIKVDFVDESGDKWQEFTVYHPQIKKWMEISGENDIKKSPWFEACADDIDWINRVKLQAEAQKHVCHAISSTINLPENVTEESVAKIYQTAFEAGLKGITVYRKNCRSGVLIDSSTKKDVENKIQKTIAPKRPKELKCDIHHINFKGKRYYVIVGLLFDEPYEVFTGQNDDGEGDTFIPKSIRHGNLVKKQKGKYTLINHDKDFSCVVTNGHSDDNADALTRLISAALRHGTAIQFIVDQLEKTVGDLTSFTKVLARTLKKYIPDGTKVTGETCPSCSGELTRENGCVGCKSCGWSRCS